MSCLVHFVDLDGVRHVCLRNFVVPKLSNMEPVNGELNGVLVCLNVVHDKHKSVF
jgi:hypothetical protein